MRQRWLVSALAGAVAFGCAHVEPAPEPLEAGSAPLDAGASASDGGAGSKHWSFAATQPIEAILLSMCVIWSATPDPSTCSGLDAYLGCARDQCGLDACMAICKEHLQCVQAAPDRCPANTACASSDECAKCSFRLLACTGVERCKGLYSCAKPSADGPCAKLAACCDTQQNPAPCRSWQEGQALLAGDEGCASTIKNPGFLKTYASTPPCTFN